MNPSLWIRKWRVVCGDLDVTDIDLSFEVGKTLKPDPNTCALTLYNLSPKSRDALSSPRAQNLLIEAGYADTTQRPGQIYLGPMRHAIHTIEGPDIVTRIESADSEKALGISRFKLAVGPKAPAQAVLQAIAKSLNVKLGNIAQASLKLAARGKVLFPVATAISGQTAKVMTDFCNSAGLEWSVQDGELQILDAGAALDTNPYILNAATGLIGSPSVDREGIVNCTTLILRGVRPGLRVILDSRFVKGVYRITEAQYSGETRGDAWYINLVCKPVKAK